MLALFTCLTVGLLAARLLALHIGAMLSRTAMAEHDALGASAAGAVAFALRQWSRALSYIPPDARYALPLHVHSVSSLSKSLATLRCVGPLIARTADLVLATTTLRQRFALRWTQEAISLSNKAKAELERELKSLDPPLAQQVAEIKSLLEQLILALAAVCDDLKNASTSALPAFGQAVQRIDPRSDSYSFLGPWAKDADLIQCSFADAEKPTFVSATNRLFARAAWHAEKVALCLAMAEEFLAAAPRRRKTMPWIAKCKQVVMFMSALPLGSSTTFPRMT